MSAKVVEKVEVEKKLEDTKFVKIICENRNPDSEERSTWCGGNNVIVDGVSTIKHYTIELGREVELPDHFVTQLEKRSMVVKMKNGKRKNVKLFVIEKVK